MIYKKITITAKSLLGNERNFITNAATLSSYCYSAIPEINWFGFYFYEGKELVLGPFAGHTACTRIKFGDGVCGACGESRETLIVNDITKIPNYIVCDCDTKSEMVVPVIVDSKVLAVLDIDSPVLNRFGTRDKTGFEELVQLYINASDFSNYMKYYGFKA